MKEYQIVKVIIVELGNAPKIEVFTQVVVELKIVFKHVLLFRESLLNVGQACTTASGILLATQDT